MLERGGKPPGYDPVSGERRRVNLIGEGEKASAPSSPVYQDRDNRSVSRQCGQGKGGMSRPRNLKEKAEGGGRGEEDLQRASGHRIWEKDLSCVSYRSRRRNENACVAFLRRETMHRRGKLRRRRAIELTGVHCFR